MRTYLVVMDETDEAKQALRFASLRAQKTDGSVHILALVPQQTFNAFGGVQATIEQEARERAEVMANSAAGNIFGEMGKMPTIAVRPGPPADVIRKYIEEHGNIAALVLATSAEGGWLLRTSLFRRGSILGAPPHPPKEGRPSEELVQARRTLVLVNNYVVSILYCATIHTYPILLL